MRRSRLLRAQFKNYSSPRSSYNVWLLRPIILDITAASLLVSTLTKAFRIPDGLLPQLVSLALGIDPSAFISADVVDISSGRDLILALRQRYPSLFEFELQFHIIGDDEEGLELEDKLCEDPDILGCVTEDFRITIIDRDLSEAR